MLSLLIIFSAFFIVVESFECSEGRLTPKQRIDIVRRNNELLSEADNYLSHGENTPELTWSCQLENSAQKWADSCFVQQSPRNEREQMDENVYTYWSSENIEKLKDTDRSWSSKFSLLSGNNPLNNFIYGVSKQGILHFTKMSLGKTHKIGCGITTQCDNGRTLTVMCHYAPTIKMHKRNVIFSDDDKAYNLPKDR